MSMIDQPKLSHHRAGLLCLMVGVLVYVNTLDCGYCYDDKAAIMDNKDLLSSSPWSNLLWNDFWGTPLHLNKSHKSYRPLCVATFRLNYLFHELQPMGYHLVNILLHGAVCYLYVQLCGLVFSQVWPALIAGLLFAVHPIHTEAVAGIVGRADLMASLFFVGSLLVYHKAVTGHQYNGFIHRGYLVSSLVLALCSFLSKETGLTVTAVCLVFDYFLLQGNTLHSTLNLLRRVTPISTNKPHPLPRWVWPFLNRLIVLVVFTGAVLSVRLWMMVAPPKFSSMDNEALSLDAPYRQLHWAHMTFVNSELLLNPSRLIHDYRMNAIPLITSLTDFRNILTITTLLAYVCLGLYSLATFDLSDSSYAETHVSNGHLINGSRHTTHRTGHSIFHSKSHVSNSTVCNGDVQLYNKLNHTDSKVVLFGLSLIVLPFLPASNLLFPVGFVVAERVLYLPSMGTSLLVAYGAWKISKHTNRSISRLTKPFFIFLLLTHATKTIVRNRDWYSKITIYGSLLRLYPSNGHILANIAREYRNIDEYDRAEAAYRTGMIVAPNVSINFINLGAMLKKQQRFKESEEVLFEAIEMLKRTLHDEQENVDKLAMVYVSVSGLVSKDPARLDYALELVEEGLKLNNSMSNAHNSRGSILLRKGRLDDSIVEFQQAIHLDPLNTNAHYNIALGYKQRGEVNKAVDMLERLLKIDNSHVLAKTALVELKQ